MTAEEWRIEHTYQKALGAMHLLGGDGPVRGRLLVAWLVELSHLYPDTLVGVVNDFALLRFQITEALEVSAEGHIRLAESFTDREVTLAVDAMRRICIACFTAHNAMLERRNPAQGSSVPPSADPLTGVLLQGALDRAALELLWIGAIDPESAVESAVMEARSKQLIAWTPDTLPS